MYFHYKPMEDNYVRGVIGLYGPQGPVCRIYEEEYYTLIHTRTHKQSSGPCGFREKEFYVCPIVSLWELMTPGIGPFFIPGA